jgi:N-acetylneuraminic acid mutarotase
MHINLFKQLGDMYILDLNKKTCSLLVPNSDYSPEPRYSHQAAIVGNYMYTFGGCYMQKNNTGTRRVMLNDLNEFDLVTMRWRSIQLTGSVPKSRVGHSMQVQLDKSVYLIIHGGQSESGELMNDTCRIKIPQIHKNTSWKMHDILFIQYKIEHWVDIQIN